MCLGIPGKVVAIVDADLQLASVDVGGVQRVISLALVDEADGAVHIGDWVLIHVGFALAKLSEADALAQLQTLEEIGDAARQEMADARTGAPTQ